MNESLRSNAFRRRLDQLTGLAALLLYALMLGMRVLERTTLDVSWPWHAREVLRAALMAAAAVRCPLSCGTDLRKWGTRALTLLMLVAAGRVDWHVQLIELGLLMVALSDVPADRILRVYFTVCIVLLVLTACASQAGVILDIVYSRYGVRGHSLGFNYPTKFAAHVFFLAPVWGAIRRGRLTWAEILLMAAAGLVMRAACGARTNAACLLLSAAVFALLKCSPPMRRRAWMLAALPVLCAAVMLLLSAAFNPDNAAFILLDRLLSGRLRLGHTALSRYALRPWGQHIHVMGYSNFNVIARSQYYFAIDSSWLLILLRYGLLFFGLLLFQMTRLAYTGARRGNPWLAAAIALFSIQACMEFFFGELTGNPFLMLVFAGTAKAPETAAVIPAEHHRVAFMKNAAALGLWLAASIVLLWMKAGWEIFPYYMGIDGTQETLQLMPGETARQIFYTPRWTAGAVLRLAPGQEASKASVRLKLIDDNTGRQLDEVTAPLYDMREDDWLWLVFPEVDLPTSGRYALEVQATGAPVAFRLAQGGERLLDAVEAPAPIQKRRVLEIATLIHHMRPGLAVWMLGTAIFGALISLCLTWRGNPRGEGRLAIILCALTGDAVLLLLLAVRWMDGGMTFR